MSLSDKVKVDQLELLHRNGLIKLIKLIKNDTHGVHNQVLLEEYRNIKSDIDEIIVNDDEHDPHFGGLFDGVQNIFCDGDKFRDLGALIYQDRFKCLDCGQSELDVVLKIDGNSYVIVCEMCGFSWEEKKKVT